MKLELTSLKKAIQSFERAVKFAEEKIIAGNAEYEEPEVLKAGVIQNFEFTYEQSWKFMKRWIEENVSHEIVDGVTRKELFRLSAENRLIVDVGEWMGYHKARNLTSHTYDADVAEQVYQMAVKFLTGAKDFLERLEKRND